MIKGYICKYNKFGYCKYGNKCFKKHENKVCEKENCEVKFCPLRHPRKCRFFMEYNYCKFGTFCRYKHKEFDDEEFVGKIEKLKTDLLMLEKDIAEKDDEIKVKEMIIKNLQEKEQNLEKENQKLKLEVKDLQSEVAEINNTVAVNDMLHEDFKERVREKYGYDSCDEESDYESDEDIRAHNRMIFRLKKAEELKKKIKCDICDFTTKSEVGLKTHKTKKHK